MYKYKDYIVRELVLDDINDCIEIMGSKQNQRLQKSIAGNDGLVLEHLGEIIGFATWSIENELVAMPVGFIIHYKVKETRRHSKGSLFLSSILLLEKLKDYKIYTSGNGANGFKNMVREVGIHGRTNRVFKFYRFKRESIAKLGKLKEKILWEVDTKK